ncbi:MAG: DUF4202 domain-containing protein [Gemmatimonadetes bacterium]|nr:DUF4202 domain-containing protein [Gemmatimonadota bacterium]
MTAAAARVERAFEEFDLINAADPRCESVDGAEQPRELMYARRMSAALARLEPDASEELRLAVRAQHIARWEIPRATFPPGRQGYKRWRTQLMEHHAAVAADVMGKVGYDEPAIARVTQLLRKQGLKRDAEVQTLEDVACLVFLENYFDGFAREHDDDKLVDILRKTWVKMSARGREAALGLDLGERASILVGRALAQDPQGPTTPLAEP